MWQFVIVYTKVYSYSNQNPVCTQISYNIVLKEEK
jgi:hypothetical protein